MGQGGGCPSLIAAIHMCSGKPFASALSILLQIKVLMTHSEKRRQNPQWGANQVNVVDFLRKKCKLESRYAKRDKAWRRKK